MKRLIFYFIIVLIAVWLGLKIQTDPGYVLISYQNWSLETTFWFGCLVIVIGFFILYFLLRVFYNSKILPQRLQNWWHRQSEKRAIRNTDLGIIKFLTGDWSAAEKKLLRAIPHSPNSFVNYLIAAESAQQLGSYKKRDTYLNKACKSSREPAEFAINLFKAQAQIKNQDFEAALAILKKLHNLNPKNALVLKLLRNIYCTKQDWQALHNLLPTLKHYNIFSKQELLELEQQIYLQLLRESKLFSQAQEIWKELPRYLKNDSTLIEDYAKWLITNKCLHEAEELVRNTLKKTWAPFLLKIYAVTNTLKPSKQLSIAEKWLKQHPKDSELLLCLGRICKKQSLWGKARIYLEKYIYINPNNALGYWELGPVLEMFEDSKKALECYKKGLTLSEEIKINSQKIKV